MGKMANKKSKRINLSVTEEQYQEIMKASDEIGESASSYCVRAINQSLGKVEKIEPKNLSIKLEPIEIYKDDIKEGYDKFGQLGNKLDRLIGTLSERNTVADFELKRLEELANNFMELEAEFIKTLNEVFEARSKEKDKIKNAAIKEIRKQLDKCLEG